MPGDTARQGRRVAAFAGDSRGTLVGNMVKPWREQMAEQVPVILADVVSSRAVEGFKSLRDERLAGASAAHRALGWVAADHAVTAGDEFQNIVTAVAHVPRLVFDLRRRFQPLELRVAIGLGGIDTRPAAGEPVNVGGTGEAFVRAREAMDYLRGQPFEAGRSAAGSRPGRKYPLFTAMRSGQPRRDATVNTIYRLLDSLLQRTTARQWQTIAAYEQYERLDRAADALGIDESTASRNLSRASYWQVLDAIAALEEILQDSGS